MPAVFERNVGVGVAGEAAVGLAEPLADQAIVVAPQNVAAAVAVEVAGARDMPAVVQLNVGVGIAGETAVRLAKPVGHKAIVVAPQNVASAVAVEIVRGVRNLQLNPAASGRP